MNQIDQAAENLLKLSRAVANEKVGKTPKRLFVICGLSGAAYQRKDGVIVVPISCLKP